jgi:hypothetical protein
LAYVPGIVPTPASRHSASLVDMPVFEELIDRARSPDSPVKRAISVQRNTLFMVYCPLSICSINSDTGPLIGRSPVSQYRIVRLH